MPWQWEQWLSNLWKKLRQPVQVFNGAFEEEEVTMLFTLIGSFVFFWMEVDNVMAFPRTHPWEILLYCLGLLPVLYSKTNLKLLFTFCPEDCCQLWIELFLEDLPSPPTPANPFWLAEGDDKPWPLASGHIWWTFYQPSTHETTVSEEINDFRAAWQCFPHNFYIWKIPENRNLCLLGNNFVSCYFPIAWIYIQIWDQEEILA